MAPGAFVRTLPEMNVQLDKQAVSPSDQTVFCPLTYRDVVLDRCLGRDRLIRADDAQPPRFIVCDARVIAADQPLIGPPGEGPKVSLCGTIGTVAPPRRTAR